jgi:predicted RNA binding protein YcfA (HicA-like mRNA interferase family)
MKLPRSVSGGELAAHLERAFGYAQVHQVGSHIVLQTESPGHHRLAVPDHKILRPGTLNSVLRAVAQAQGIAKAEVLVRLFG